MKGTEEVFESMLQRSIHERKTPGFHYVEIGIAKGATLAAVADHLREHMPGTWRATGVDLVCGEYFHATDFLRSTLSHEVVIDFAGSGNRQPFISGILNNDIRIMLLKSNERRPLCEPRSLNFCLIDGCHGAPCVTKDFLAIENAMALNGIVAFHDAMPEDQGVGWQAHCGMHISVREALNKLDLTTRPGWKWVGNVSGDKSQSANGFEFFQRQSIEQPVYQEGFTG